MNAPFIIKSNDYINICVKSIAIISYKRNKLQMRNFRQYSNICKYEALHQEYGYGGMRINKMLLAICTISLLATSIKSVAQQPTNRPDTGTIKQGSGTSTKKAPISSPTPSQNVLTLNDTTAVQQTNKETDWITMVVSLLSLLVSSAVAYSSNFRKERIQLCFGRDIILFPVPKTNVTTSSTSIAGVGFNLPITFYNWSPKGGTIQRIRLVVSKQGHDDCYDMTWTTFVKIENSEFQDENLAQPIAIKGLSSVNKVIRFDWITEIGGRQFQVKTGDYELMIYA
ncbi:MULTISPECIES: hypothetical protein [unclassified Microcoleus]|uniref:hypothetical protein n=1 Tax=unclassified Microcoleus TaxID=2642155 RepID=UPI002FD34731